MKYFFLILTLCLSFPIWAQGTLTTLQNLHKVMKDETVESIAAHYGISGEEILQANPEIKKKKLKKGSFIVIPTRPAMQEESEMQQEAAVDEIVRKEHYQAVRMAVLLPLEDSTEVGKSMVEFYQGILMAADSVKAEGTDLIIHAVHTGSTTQEMQDILAQNDFSEMNLIVGPENEKQQKVLLRYCQEHAIRLVLPFSTGEDLPVCTTPVYFPFLADRSALAEVPGRMCQTDNKGNYIVLESPNPDQKGKEFAEAFRKVLTNEGLAWKTLPLNNDLKPEDMLENEADNFIILDNSDIRTFNILSAKMDSYLQSHPECRTTLYGFPGWLAYTSNLLGSFFSMNTYIPTNYYYNPLKGNTGAFEKNFTRNFHATMRPVQPRYAMMGFDMGYYFLHGLAVNGDFFEEKQSKQEYDPLQCPLSFVQEKDGMAYTNHAIQIIHYTNSQTIEIIR